MSQAVWTGSISFGLVSIPVKMYPATEPKDVRFHLYDRRSGKRVHYERVTRDYEPPVFEPDPPAFDLGGRRATPRPDEPRWERAEREDPRGRSDRGDEAPDRLRS